MVEKQIYLQVFPERKSNIGRGLDKASLNNDNLHGNMKKQ